MREPELSDQGLSPTHEVAARDQYGDVRTVRIAGERPLTLKVDEREVVTLMTLGMHPEELALGYLRNQRLVERLEDIAAVRVDWERETVSVDMRPGCGITDWEEKLSQRTVTTGCGQGTVFSCTLDKLYDQRLPKATVRQSLIYRLLANIASSNQIYKESGAVHGCALCVGEDILMFVEDVGRHNAADTIAGRMWLQRHGRSGQDFLHDRATDLRDRHEMCGHGHSGAPVTLRRHADGRRTCRGSRSRDDRAGQGARLLDVQLGRMRGV